MNLIVSVPGTDLKSLELNSIECDRYLPSLPLVLTFPPGVFGCSTDQISRMTRSGSLTGTFEVLHEYPLEFEGYLLSCAEIPGAKESDPD
jgi:hypothetical protein